MKQLFTPLGIDHLIIACKNSLLRSNQLALLGFRQVGDYDAYFGRALGCGNTRIFLVDSKTKRFTKSLVSNFIHKHGDMQVMEVSIRVDSIRHVAEEMRQWSESQQLTTRNYHEDTFGNCVTVDFVFLYRQAFQYSFTQRLDKFIPGIDHVAIAVDSLDQYVQLYKDFGFHVVYAPRKKKGLIQGERSAMRTYALRRGGLTVALVQGVDQKDTSQVTMYVRQHGNHSLHHAALLTTHLSKMVASYLANGIGFRLYRVP